METTGTFKKAQENISLYQNRISRITLCWKISFKNNKNLLK